MRRVVPPAPMRLVATDLDGTLLRPDGTVSPRTAAALRRAAAHDVPVTIVTGRPLRWLSTVYAQLDARPTAVCANGAVVYDPDADRVLRADPLAPDLLAEVARRLRDGIPGVRFAVEVADGREMRHEDAYELWLGEQDEPARVIRSPEELYAVPAVKLLVRADGGDAEVFPARVTACLEGLAEATHSSDSGLVEISAAGITKAAGLAWLCERLGVAAENVVAFGDMPNDVPMLTWAGHAVAVANAHPAVREVADELTLTNADDGVAAYLETRLAALDDGGRPAAPALDGGPGSPG